MLAQLFLRRYDHSSSAMDSNPADLIELLAAFKDKLDEETINAIVEEFHGDIVSAYEVLAQLAEARNG